MATLPTSGVGDSAAPNGWSSTNDANFAEDTSNGGGTTTLGQCTGNTEDHCCYVNGVACPHLVENVEGRRWACGLRAELGNWEAVHADPRYLADVKPQWIKVGIVDCGDWPEPQEKCHNCGVVGVT